MPNQDSLPALVQRWTDGDTEAFDRVVEIVYDDLRAIAHSHLRRERTDHTLNTTALVHEAYLQLSNRTGPSWLGRAQFFALVSNVMRNLLIAHARKRSAAKRGANPLRVPLDEIQASTETELVDLLWLDQALDRLGEHDERMARIVECRFFGGMPHSEIGEAIGISTRTVDRDWTRARAYLLTALSSNRSPGETNP